MAETQNYHLRDKQRSTFNLAYLGSHPDVIVFDEVGQQTVCLEVCKATFEHEAVHWFRCGRGGRRRRDDRAAVERVDLKKEINRRQGRCALHMN